MANKTSDHQPAPVFYFDVVGDYEKTDKSPKGREDRVAYSTTNYLKTPIGSNPQKYNSKVEDGMAVNRDANLNGASKKGQSKIQGKGKKRNGGKWNEKESSREVMGSGVVYENTLKIGGVTLMLDNNISSKTNSYGAKAGTKSQRNTIVNNKNNKKNTNRIQKQPTSRSFSQNNYVNEYPIGVIEFDYENEKNTNRMQKQSTSHYTSESKYINEYPIGGIEIEYDSLELGTPSKAVDTEEEMSLQDYIDVSLSFCICVYVCVYLYTR
ncbi:hypothetical protein AX774_g594 [Zancudomyces culisetae]|uniref:Uncharacterized protein n=1 Tax=Zancudomyces culisetae TaxID=1213189 RepID=A0A1R1PY34_ZANCU|nr:hypothetical protein AX774_g594 [Zancudomyces culisetae]|eukprot:OMH85849.1 hypothetical protein AX774_g594 [Zancudomyces culisetae]